MITKSTRITPGTYKLPADPSLDSALITIRGGDIALDLRDVRIEGTPVEADPDAARGVAIRIDSGERIAIVGGTVRGYMIAVLVRGTRDLLIDGMNLSHNWKPRLFSQLSHESLVDWLSYHQNEKREWMRFGAAIYLEDVRLAHIDHVRAEQGMNGLLMTRTDSSLVSNSIFAFNSGLGIGMYRSSENVLTRNIIDYNVRGYSHGWYRRGQDSAGLLMYEQSSGNIVAWNSVTHSGDGLFLWAGQHTMDSGEGGANDNLFFGNDFSFAPTNGIEATFSRNRFIANVVEGNDHGVWGGYSFSSEITGNCFARNRVGIAIEHGQDNAIMHNSFAGDTTAVYLWANPIEPSDWGYPKFRDTRSRDYRVAGNSFVANGTVWRVLQTTAFDTTDNTATAFTTGGTGDTASGRSTGNTGGAGCAPRELLKASYDSLAPAELGAPRAIPKAQWPRRDRSAIVVDEWGPFDWRSPKLWPVDSMQDAVKLRTLGPDGRWRIVQMRGVRGVSARAGRIGDTLEVRPIAGSEGNWRVELEYVGAATISPRGERKGAGVPVRFDFERWEPTATWEVKYFSWSDSLKDPQLAAGNLDAILSAAPILTRTESRLDYEWYRPRFGLPLERWALDATATIEIPAGDHQLRIISDDAALVWVDDLLVAERKEPGGSEVMYAPIASGRHRVRVAYYQVGGWTELRVDVLRGKSRSLGSAGPH